MKILTMKWRTPIYYAIIGVLFGHLLASCQLFRTHPKKAEVAFFAALDLETPPLSRPTLVIGDQRIASWRSLVIDLEEVRPINRGIDQLLINDLYFFRHQLVEKYRPQILVLYLGEEELRLGENLEKILADYHRLLEKISPWASRKIIIQSIILSPQKRYLLPQIEELNTALNRLSTQFVNVDFLDISKHFPESVFQHDLNSLNDQGHQLWRTKLLNKLDSYPKNKD